MKGGVVKGVRKGCGEGGVVKGGVVDTPWTQRQTTPLDPEADSPSPQNQRQTLPGRDDH